jgi:predicted transcriptional regulator
VAGRSNGNSARPKVFSWLDANANTFTRSQVIDEISREFTLTPKTARVYVSKWRKANGVSRIYTKKEKSEP